MVLPLTFSLPIVITSGASRLLELATATGPILPTSSVGILYAAAAVFLFFTLRQEYEFQPIWSGRQAPTGPRWTPPTVPALFCGAVLAYGGVLATGAASSVSATSATSGKSLVSPCPVVDPTSGDAMFSLIGPWPGVFFTPVLALPLIALAGFAVWSKCSRHAGSAGEILRHRSAVALAAVGAGLGTYMTATLYHEAGHASCNGSSLLTHVTMAGACTAVSLVTLAAASAHKRSDQN